MSTKLILLIADETNVREVIQACLSDLGGWNVLSIASPEEYLQRLNVEKPDVILLDVLMPEVDGVTLIQKLRENPVACSIPIILLTAKASWFTLQQLQELGAVSAIAKPFNPVILPDRIASILGWS